MKFAYLLLVFLAANVCAYAQGDGLTYAEKLGFPKGKKVVILHVDDVGMSSDSNEGTIDAMTKGVANSCSIMMTCPWVPGYFHYLKEHPQTDAGLHLTLTSEWKDYRWFPLSGKARVPGLVDPEGAFWPSVAQVVKNASPDEVEMEIRAQLERALQFGFRPTHLDSHMGTLFASPAFTERYLKVGIEFKIPVMFPGGHNTLITRQMGAGSEALARAQHTGRLLWDAGLPVLDDLHNESYGWKLPESVKITEKNIRRHKTAYYKKALQSLKPGLTMVIMHCINPTEVFPKISDSGITRQGDWLAMTDPELKAFIQKEGIILTTWRELMERRKKAE